MNQESYKKLISGQSQGVIASVLRILLNVASFFYLFVIDIRNSLYDGGTFRSYSVTSSGLKTTDRSHTSVPVISVGNITAGGTGKTPMVIWLCNWLSSKGIKCAILTRGYKATAGGKNDEPTVIVRHCPQANLVVNPDRLAGTIEAVKRYNSQVLIMDDGFQHRKLHRDIDIVMIDGTSPFGYGKLLPAGLLREPPSSLKRAHAAVITKCDLVPEQDITKLAEIIKVINPDIVIARATHNPVCAIASGEKEITLEELKHKKIFAFCGIGNPDAFLNTINRLGIKVEGSKIYNDHHNYASCDTDEIFQKAEEAGAQLILTTEKDFDKIDPAFVGKTSLMLAYLSINIMFIEGEGQIRQLIETVLTGKISKKR